MRGRIYETLHRENPDATTFQRWFNETENRIERAMEKGYRPVLRNGKEVRQVVGPGLTALLMEIPKIKRNLDGFFAKRKGMGAAVKARILRLNPTIEEGGKIRGWHPAPTAKEQFFLRAIFGKGWVIRNYGREQWDKLKEAGLTVKYGKREYAAQEGLIDATMWLKKDHIAVQDYIRRSRRHGTAKGMVLLEQEAVGQQGHGPQDNLDRPRRFPLHG